MLLTLLIHTSTAQQPVQLVPLTWETDDYEVCLSGGGDANRLETQQQSSHTLHST